MQHFHLQCLFATSVLKTIRNKGVALRKRGLVDTSSYCYDFMMTFITLFSDNTLIVHH